MNLFSIEVFGSSIPIHAFDVITIVIGILVSIILGIKARHTGSHQLRNYIPTAWTSLGIFFTFVSIWWSLGESKDKSFDPQMMRDLISSIVPAFSTSIIGILGAFVSSICNKWIIAKEEQEENNKFLRLKKQKVGKDCNSDSPELILLEIISSIRESTDTTCTALGKNHSDSDKTIQEIKNRILESGFGVTNKVIETSIATQQENFISAITDLTNIFKESMNTQQSTFATQLGELRLMLRDEVQNIANTNQTLLTKLLDQEKQLLELTTTKLFDESSQRNESLKEFIANGNAKIEEYFDIATVKIVELYNKISEDISHHIKIESELFEHDIKDSIESFARGQYEICSTAIEKYNADLVNYTHKAVESQTTVNEKYIAVLENKLSETSEAFISSVGKVSDILSRRLESIHAAEIEKIDIALAENRVGLKTLVDENKAAVQSVAADISSRYTSFKDAVVESQEKLRCNLKDIQEQHCGEVIKIQQTVKDEMSETAKSISEISSGLQGTLASIVEKITESVSEFTNQQETLKKHIIKHNSDLSANIAKQIYESARISELEDASTNLTSKISNCMLDFQNKMDIIVKHLDQTGSYIDESSKSYRETIDQSSILNQYIESTTDLFKHHMTALKTMKSSMDSMESSVKRMTERMDTIIAQFAKVSDRKQSQKSKEQQK